MTFLEVVDLPKLSFSHNFLKIFLVFDLSSFYLYKKFEA